MYIDDSEAHICIPTNPYNWNWLFRRNCESINKNYIFYDKKRAEFKANKWHKINLDELNKNKKIIGVNGLIFTEGKQFKKIEYQLNINKLEFFGQLETNKKGMIFFHNEGLIEKPFKNIKSAKIKLNKNAFLPVNGNGELILNWYGY